MLNVIFDVGSFDQTYVYGMIAAAVVLAGGSALGSLAARAGLPRTLGYLVTGIIIGPMAFALVSQKQLSDLRGVTDMMIGIFAFEIGTELYIGKLKSKKNPIVLIALIQNLVTFFLVMLVFSMFVSIEAAILIGAVASATSPIPIVVQHRNWEATKQTRFSKIIKSISGMDVIFATLIFSVAISYVTFTHSGSTQAISSTIGNLLTSILIAAGIGTLAGLAGRLTKSYHWMLIITLSSVLLGVALSEIFHLSSLLVAILSGAVFTNFNDKEHFKMHYMAVDKFIQPLIIGLFVILGATINFNYIRTNIIYVLVYVVVRFAGKYIGSYLATKTIKADDGVKKSLWRAMMPQGGIVLGFVIMAEKYLPEDEVIKKVVQIVLAGMVIYEFIGPIFVDIAIKRAQRYDQEVASKIENDVLACE